VAPLIDGLPESTPRWPIAVMRIYAGIVFLGAALAQLPPHPSQGLFILSLDLVIGVALTLGAATRAAALLAVAIVVRDMLPVNGIAVLVSPGPRTAFLILLLTVILGRGGRVLGFDARFAPRQPENPLW
jgi:hypothetical protein